MHLVLKYFSFSGEHPLTSPPALLVSHPALPILFVSVLQILFYFDIVFTTIFTIEIALKVKPRPLSLPSSLCQSQLSAGRCLSCR